MLGIIIPLPVIGSSIFSFVDTMDCFFVLYEHAGVFSVIFPDVDAVTVHFIVFSGAIIFAAIKPLIYSL